MLNVEERKRVQDKLVLLTAGELCAVDDFIESLMAKRLRIVNHLQGL